MDKFDTKSRRTTEKEREAPVNKPKPGEAFVKSVSAADIFANAKKWMG